jgi:hypothetical protein
MFLLLIDSIDNVVSEIFTTFTPKYTSLNLKLE